MKSAYELAMERLMKAGGPAKTLTDEQKARIAEIEKMAEARIAELKVGYDARIANASSVQEVEQLRAELARSVATAESDRDAAKDAVWNEAGTSE